MPKHADPDRRVTEDDAADAWRKVLAGPELEPEPGDLTPQQLAERDRHRARRREERRQERRVPEEERSRQARRQEEGDTPRPPRPRDERGRFRAEEEEAGEDDEEFLDEEGSEYDDVEYDEGEYDDEDPDFDEGTDEEQLFTVKSDGEELQVPLEELKKGYSRTAYLTRRTQEAASREREAEAVLGQLTAERHQYQQLTARLAQRLSAEAEGLKPDPSIRETNPVRYLAMESAWREKQAEANAARREQARVAAANERAQQALRTSVQQREHQLLLDAVPEWKQDPEAGKAERRELYQWAMDTFGWTEKELNGVTDHRLLLVLRDSKILRDSNGKVRPRKRKKPGPVGTGSGDRSRRIGASRRKNRSKGKLKQATQRVRETGSKADAVDAMAEYLRRKRS